MAGKRAAGEGTFWQRGEGWYGKRRVGPREAVVTINGSGATRAEAAADLREKVTQYERGLTVNIDSSATLAHYLDWWLSEELAEQVSDGSLMATTLEQYANKVQHQIVPLIGHLKLRDVSPLQLRQWSPNRRPPRQRPTRPRRLRRPVERSRAQRGPPRQGDPRRSADQLPVNCLAAGPALCKVLRIPSAAARGRPPQPCGRPRTTAAAWRSWTEAAWARPTHG